MFSPFVSVVTGGLKVGGATGEEEEEVKNTLLRLETDDSENGAP